jgi:hypothetical protein
MAKTKSDPVAGNKRKSADVMPAEVDAPELVQVQTDGNLITGFLSALVPFFRKATELEQHGKTLLAQAKALQPPRTGAEDGTVQTFIKTAKAGRTDVDTLWNGPTGAFNRVHKLLVAGRHRGTGPYEEAASIAQYLHNTYAAMERQRVEAEQRRLREEAEARERARLVELARRLEEQAAAAEDASPDLSPRERAFVVYYDQTADAVNAARRAGFPDPRKAADRLLKSAKVQAAIAAAYEARTLRHQAAVTRTQPVAVVTETVEADLVRVGSDRTYKSAEIYDPRAFVAAVIASQSDGQNPIPADTLMPSQTALNEYARSMGERINAWPGVRLKVTVKTI